MDKTFASVEWLSQSSVTKEDTETSFTKKDQAATCLSWTPVMGSVPETGHVALHPETHGLISPRINHASSHLWDNENPTSSKDCEVTSSPSKESSHMDMEISHSPMDNGQCNASENSDSTSKDSNISQECTSSSQESGESQGKQTRIKEEFTHSGSQANNDSGYDSEICLSRSISPDSGEFELSSEVSDEEGKPGRRLRTAFTSEQITTLEATFQHQKYLGASERRKLSLKLNLSEVQIKTWFQNRRMKFKREVQEVKPIQFHPAQFYGMYGYPTLPMPAYPFPHPGQPLHIPNRLDPMSYNYPSPHLAFETFNPFNPMMYPHQTFIPPAYRQQ